MSNQATQSTLTAPVMPPQTKPVDPKSLNWQSLGFSYLQTRCFVRRVWRDGKWGQPELLSGEYIPMHISSSGIHYSQSCFEGLKAFRAPDGKVRIFRPDLNAERMADSARRCGMEPVPTDVFLHDVALLVRENIDYVPPHGNGCAFYIRPLLFGSGPIISVAPSNEFTFIVFGFPVGDYYRGGIKSVPALIVSNFDRAAPQGVGSAKLAGNYAPCLPSGLSASQRGFPITLFLDAKTHTLIEEFATANFIALKRNPAGSKTEYTLVTPNSSSILPSVTRRSLCDLAARNLGWSVENRPVPYEEVRRGEFVEVAACGTAVVITPVNRIVRDVPSEDGKTTVEEETRISPEYGDELGPGLRKLYNLMISIQFGTTKDEYGWLWPKEGL
jgi:branched-chain amino acid aminotransferase